MSEMANEKRLIDANKLIEHLTRCIDAEKGLFRAVCVAIKCFVEQMPTVDYVEVVRCKDCKRTRMFVDSSLLCILTTKAVKAEDFCSYGERRDEE